MSKKGKSFWDNPFGGMFDFNRDGKEDWAERAIALRMLDQYRKKQEASRQGYSSGLFDDAEDFDSYEWRLFCEDGFEYGVDPEDYETEEEYGEALNEARYGWRDDCESALVTGVDPEDYETEEEYQEALEEERTAWRYYCDEYILWCSSPVVFPPVFVPYGRYRDKTR